MEEEGYLIKENKALSPFWSKVRCGVTSPWVQMGMSALVVLYLTTTVLEILAGMALRETNM
ncbi:hypothetical protein DSO57_1038564 [Entomophthora muscae]|uniref:Uncharacterized protein n=1 Tax=Entomophthora muscae TaxID=34485 RepID=A0ACC2RDF7_9FUNG|nr:hypothetical protein DSO57_1038564 [Entomophthora muscae]